MSIIEQCIPRKVLPKRRKLPWDNAFTGKCFPREMNIFASVASYECLIDDVNHFKPGELSLSRTEKRHAIRKRNYLYCKSKCNPDFRAKYKQQCNKVGSAKRSFIVTIPTGNTKEFWRAIKLLNGKGSQTIPVINHDGRQLVSDQ